MISDNSCQSLHSLNLKNIVHGPIRIGSHKQVTIDSEQQRKIDFEEVYLLDSILIEIIRSHKSN